ncbi:tetratricopeptide repeat protein [Massilia sp. BJB1822]|uniref:tetratricopeptide repeat protein n=1 Tax=Massilia sp. BJB1822 TaxID=2744470 RepID=UPI001594DCE4|nr:tetratricopeptide repeat protein [Massilia sp. BJB1822]NVD98621.1 tetratricopeptide repeat protein [Massilia sp. BJB1822]
MERFRFSLPPLSTSGEVSSFYSHQDGCGRSAALAHLAALLAGGQRAATPILMVDWNLEAPRLHQYFPLQDDGPGVLELFEACRAALAGRQNAGRDSAAVAREVLDAVGWEQYVCRVDESRPLYLMRAGRQDASYERRLADLRWELLFDACPALFRCFAASLNRHFRHVLVDSCSGRADMAGICTTLLPTRLVLAFPPGRQHLDGLTALLQRATTYRRSHEDEQRPLLAYPLPIRGGRDDAAQRLLWRRGDPARAVPGYQPLFEQALGEAYGMADLSLESYFDEVQLPPLREASGGEPALSAAGGDQFSLLRALGVFREWLGGGHAPWQSRAEIPLQEAIAAARLSMQDGGAALSLPLAHSLERLAGVYCQENRLWQAMQCLQESRTLLLRLLGAEHADTRRCTRSLAALFQRQGRPDEARRLQDAAAAWSAIREEGEEGVDSAGEEGERRHCMLKVQQERRAYHLGPAVPWAGALPDAGLQEAAAMHAKVG